MGAKLPSTADRRVQKTHRALRDALVALLIDRGWDGFSVQDVCERANVGRSTFYTHFADKEELVAGAFEDLKRTVRARVVAQAGGGSRPLTFSRGLIEHAHEQRRLFLALVGKRSGHVVQRKFRELVLGLVRDDLAGVLAAGTRRDAASAFLGGAFIELLTWSLETRISLDPEAVDALFHELSAPVLAEAARTGR